MKLFEVDQSEVNNFIQSFEQDACSHTQSKLKMYCLDFDNMSDNSDCSNTENSPNKLNEVSIFEWNLDTKQVSSMMPGKREVRKLNHQFKFDHINTKSDLLNIFHNN